VWGCGELCRRVWADPVRSHPWEGNDDRRKVASGGGVGSGDQPSKRIDPRTDRHQTKGPKTLPVPVEPSGRAITRPEHHGQCRASPPDATDNRRPHRGVRPAPSSWHAGRGPAAEQENQALHLTRRACQVFGTS
jgi:hypothetical protein